jgi:hypothetical protein
MKTYTPFLTRGNKWGERGRDTFRKFFLLFFPVLFLSSFGFSQDRANCNKGPINTDLPNPLTNIVYPNCPNKDGSITIAVGGQFTGKYKITLMFRGINTLDGSPLSPYEGGQIQMGERLNAHEAPQLFTFHNLAVNYYCIIVEAEDPANGCATRDIKLDCSPDRNVCNIGPVNTNILNPSTDIVFPNCPTKDGSIKLAIGGFTGAYTVKLMFRGLNTFAGAPLSLYEGKIITGSIANLNDPTVVTFTGLDANYYCILVETASGCATRDIPLNCKPCTTCNEICYESPTNPTVVNAKSTFTINPNGTITIRTTLAKTFVDNTYGTNAIGWPGGHKFSNLTGSDNLQLALFDATGVKRLEFKMDYLTASNGAPSGYKSLGVMGGDGKMLIGNPNDVLSVQTSLDKNFNDFGYVLTENSPATDANYTPNPSAPNWIYDVWYEVTVRASAFGNSGFGYPRITDVHASPSKTGKSTEVVVPCVPPPPPPPGTPGEICYQSPTNPNVVSAKSTWTIDQAAQTVTIRTTLAKTFVDNTYGTNAIGWPKGHKFKDLVGSDNLQLALYDNNGARRLEFKMDYLSKSKKGKSGFTSLGVTGGDGKMIAGSASHVVKVVTSLDKNLNANGPSYYGYTINSPATDANYTPNPSAPNWDYNVWYEVTVKLSAFGSSGFGRPGITDVHASPSKTGKSSEEVKPGPCTSTPPPPPGNPGEICYQSPTNPTVVNAKSTFTINQAAQTITIRTTLAKTFVDNTYGTNAIGWPKGHSFSNLKGSDNLQLALFDATGGKRLEFKMDYISATDVKLVPSGYASLGVMGGDGKMLIGNASDVVDVITSLDKNFNEFGYVLTENSPATDNNYTPNPTYPNWIYEVWYEVTVKLSAFGSTGFGYPRITDVHASPSKTGNNTEVVVPCPPARTAGSAKATDETVAARSHTREAGSQQPVVDRLTVMALPNPSINHFTLQIQSKESASVTIRVQDISGRTIKVMKQAANGTVRFGSDLKKGVYLVEVAQGDEKRLLKLVKL